MANKVLIDRRSAKRNKKRNQSIDRREFVDLLQKKFSHYKRHVEWCNNLCGHWRIRVWQTKENAVASEAAFELTRLWLFNHCKSFDQWPEQQRESGKQQAWTQFKAEHLDTAEEQ